jgi:hypothetical protein
VEQDLLKQEIRAKNENLARLEDEISRVSEEKKAAADRNKKLKHQIEEYHVPEVLDYVKLNAEIHEIHKKIKDWERKVEIAQMAYKKQLPS